MICFNSNYRVINVDNKILTCGRWFKRCNLRQSFEKCMRSDVFWVWRGVGVRDLFSGGKLFKKNFCFCIFIKLWFYRPLGLLEGYIYIGRYRCWPQNILNTSLPIKTINLKRKYKGTHNVVSSWYFTLFTAEFIENHKPVIAPSVPTERVIILKRNFPFPVIDFPRQYLLFQRPVDKSTWREISRTEGYIYTLYMDTGYNA